MKTEHYNYAHGIFEKAMDFFDNMIEEIKKDFHFSCELHATTHGFQVLVWFSLSPIIIEKAEMLGIDVDKHAFIHTIYIYDFHHVDIDADTDKYLQELHGKVNELTTRLADVVKEIKETVIVSKEEE